MKRWAKRCRSSSECCRYPKNGRLRSTTTYHMLSEHAYELISAGLLFTVPYFFSKKPLFDRDNENPDGVSFSWLRGWWCMIISPALASSVSIRRLNLPGRDLLAILVVLLGGLSGVCAYLHVCIPDWRSTVWQCSNIIG